MALCCLGNILHTRDKVKVKVGRGARACPALVDGPRGKRCHLNTQTQTIQGNNRNQVKQHTKLKTKERKRRDKESSHCLLPSISKSGEITRSSQCKPELSVLQDTVRFRCRYSRSVFCVRGSHYV
ncbi:hypothetical protein BaRGS_00003583 [Batillaria attramentaria]|uniref:Uncharacterized protein n=1 Tax=Batillaria attramentaria TaxID=370345 RepID=A0ABD0LZX7_9CAEN